MNKSSIISDSSDFIYNPCQLKYSKFTIGNEGLGYGACSFELNSMSIIFRVARTTPKKIGQFVTLWKRIKNGTIQPYDISEDFDLFVIVAREDDKFGQFIFPKSVLLENGIISRNGKGGKLAIRIYPPWDITISPQAKKTQVWQLQYFLEVQKNKSINCDLAKKLYSAK
jgi:hypothetical protein